MAFHKGQRVEVASKEEGFLGSYYSASIIAEHHDGSYIVEYTTLLESDESGPLVEKVNGDEIRQLPFHIPVSEFNLNDDVDAYDDGGWWVGRIVGKVEGGYSVYFDISQVRGDYQVEMLRKHLKWSVHRRSSAPFSEPAPVLGSRGLITLLFDWFSNFGKSKIFRARKSKLE